MNYLAVTLRQINERSAEAPHDALGSLTALPVSAPRKMHWPGLERFPLASRFVFSVQKPF
ncbi:hypothetical protein [Microvirga vignae]|uniref:hypothetical protein n=1 Tax=Microvirga vignae TaxID=1225564 RepID=UPI000ABD946B|nr:hypothetical protein [Microvirga vignae]